MANRVGVGKEQTISWIFVAIAIASQGGPAKMTEIKNTADWINRAIPTESEMKLSVNKLIELGLINKITDAFELTSKGQEEYSNAESQSSVLLNIWMHMEGRIRDYNKET